MCVKRVLALLAAVLCFVSLVGMGPAGSVIDCSVFIDGYDGSLALYRVGDEAMNFDQQYIDSGLDLDVSTEAAFRRLCTMLEDYVVSSGVAPMATMQAENGKVRFENVPVGMYLITGEKFASDKGTWFVAPFVNVVKEDVAIEFKSSFVPADKKVQLTVEKKWRNCDPGSDVQVDILRDGDVFDTIVLNDENSWRQDVMDLDANYKWSAAEHEVPDGYVCSVEINDGYVLLVNTKEEVAEPTPTPPPMPTVGPSVGPSPSISPDPTPVVEVPVSTPEPTVSPSPIPVDTNPVTGLENTIASNLGIIGVVLLIGIGLGAVWFVLALRKKD